MEKAALGRCEIALSKTCLGTITFGEPVDEATARTAPWVAGGRVAFGAPCTN